MAWREVVIKGNYGGTFRQAFSGIVQWKWLKWWQIINQFLNIIKLSENSKTFQQELVLLTFDWKRHSNLKADFSYFFLYYNDSKKVDNDYNSMIMIMIFTKLWMSLEEVILILIFCRSHNIHSFIHLQASSITGLLALTWCVSYEKHTLNLFIEIKNTKKAKYFNRWIKTNMAK